MEAKSIASVGIALVASFIGINSFCYGQGISISWSLYFLGIFMSAILGTLIYLKIALDVSPPIQPTPKNCKLLELFHAAIIESLPGENNNKENSSQKMIESKVCPVFSRNIDKEIEVTLQKFIDEYIMSWLEPLIREDQKSLKNIHDIIMGDFWEAFKRLNERLSNIDKVQFVACEMINKVTEHFERIRLAIQQNNNHGDQIEFSIHDFIISKDREMEFLAKVADILILFLLPKSYLTCLGTRSTLRELLSRHVLYSTIDFLSNPKNINSFLIQWIEDQDKTENNSASISKKSSLQETLVQININNANSYEEFNEALNSSNDVEFLKQHRSKILTEIVQATTFDHLNKSKENTTTTTTTSNSNLTFKKNEDDLSEYVTHLVKAKSTCELRLEELGCNLFGSKVNNSGDDDLKNNKSSLENNDVIDGGGQILSFAAIMNSPFSRRYFYAFLENQGKQDLLGFWAAVEELKESEKLFWHQLATEIFYTYINKPTRVIRVSRSWLKQIELFLMGDSGPEIFYEIQKDVTKTLETDFYPVFLISESMYRMLEEAHENNIKISEKIDLDEDSLLTNLGTSETKRKSIEHSHDSPFRNHIAKAQLEHLDEKLQNKVQALKALQSSLKPDSKILKMLQEQVQNLQKEHLEVQQHLERTEAWTEYLGQWRCHVQTVDYLEKEDVLKAVLIVHVPFKKEGNKQIQRPSPSWVCSRNIQEFHSMHKELMPYFSWLKEMTLPSTSGASGGSSSNSLINFGNRHQSNQAKTEKTRSVLQKYMDAVLSDDRLNQSEIVYSFLSPSPDYLKKSANEKSSSKNLRDQKFHLSNFFKSTDLDHELSNRSDATNKRLRWLDSHYHDVLADYDTTDLGGGDGVAEPFYSLLGEVFDMRGVFKIVRKSLMTFVQITYGSTISRKVKDTVAWITSEHMVIKYLRNINAYLWRSEEENQDEKILDEKSPEKTKQMLLEHIPEWLDQLVGQQASKKGTAKVFDVLQEKYFNKLLVYNLLEVLIYSLFPELVRSYAFQQIRDISL